MSGHEECALEGCLIGTESCNMYVSCNMYLVSGLQGLQVQEILMFGSFLGLLYRSHLISWLGLVSCKMFLFKGYCQLSFDYYNYALAKLFQPMQVYHVEACYLF